MRFFSARDCKGYEVCTGSSRSTATLSDADDSSEFSSESLLLEIEEIDEESPLYIFESCPQQRAFEIIRGRCYWTGQWWRDYWYHVRNSHPLLGCCLCDCVSPYTHAERTAVFIAVLLLSILPAAAFLTAMKDRYYSPVETKIYYFLFFTLPVFVAQYAIEYAIYAREVFKSYSSYHKYGAICRTLYRITHTFQSQCSLLLILVSLVLNLIGCLFLSVDGKSVGQTVKPLIISRIEFWIIWFATDMFMPWIGFAAWWRKEKLQEELRVQAIEARKLVDEEPPSEEQLGEEQREDIVLRRTRSKSLHLEWARVSQEDRFSCNETCRAAACLGCCCPCGVDVRLHLSRKTGA